MHLSFARLVPALVLALLCAPLGRAQSPEELFNGKDLSGWKGHLDHWSVEDGAITGRSTTEKPLTYNTFLVWEGEVENFELKLRYRIQGGNSGIQYRSQLIDAEKFIVGGYQADIDSQKRFTGINYEERGRGILAERGQIVAIDAQDKLQVVGSTGDSDALIAQVKDDDWNEYRLVAKGSTLQHYINDKLMSEVQDPASAKAASKGVIALQLHTGPPMKVQFKDLRLTRLP